MSFDRPVEVTEMRTVCRTTGSYECRSYTDCCGCVHTCRVWVPRTYTEQVPVTVCRTEMVEQPFEYTVTLYRQEMRTVTSRVCRMRVEMQSKQVPYTYCVPRQVERVANVTTFRPVAEQKVVPTIVMVPHTEYRQVQVCRTRLVPKEITCVVPCAACGG